MQIEKFRKIFFLGYEPNNLYLAALGAPRHVCQRNMITELPVFRIWQSKPCARIKYPILGCVLHTHGSGCQIRNNGRLAPIFRRQANLVFCHIIWRHITHWCVNTQKLMPSRFLAPWINARIWHWSWRRRKSAWHRFLCTQTPTREMPPYFI